MSIEVMTRVWANSKQKGSALLLMVSIADYANEKGVAYPSIETLARKVRMSERNVQLLLRKLEEAGELDIKANAGPAGCNLYRIVLDEDDARKGGEKISPPPVKTLHPGGEIQREGGEIQRAEGVKASSPDPSLDPPIDPSENTARAQAPVQAQQVKAAAAPAVTTSEYQAVVKAYQNEIGMLTPMISEGIKAQMQQSPTEWVIRAIGIAAMRNNRRWAYVEGILRRWQTEGFDGDMDNLSARTGNAAKSGSKSMGYGRQMQQATSKKGPPKNEYENDPEYLAFLASFNDGAADGAAVAAD
jgi:DnaD/phage-associated family protein